MNTENGKLAKVRALLAKAENSAVSPEEAALYREKAFQIMAAYGIEQAMISEAAPADQAEKVSDRRIVIRNPYGMDKSRLLNEIVGALGCEAIRLTGAVDLTVRVFGFPSDLARLDILFTSLLLQMAREQEAARPYGVPNARAWSHAFRIGFIVEVSQRLKAAEQRARAAAEQPGTGRSAELVLADRADQVVSAFRSAYPKTRKGGSARVSDTAGGLTAGRAAGQRADIGQTGVNTNRRSSLGS